MLIYAFDVERNPFTSFASRDQDVDGMKKLSGIGIVVLTDLGGCNRLLILQPLSIILAT